MTTTFQHRGFKVSDAKDIDLNGQALLNIGGNNKIYPVNAAITALEGTQADVVELRHTAGAVFAVGNTPPGSNFVCINDNHVLFPVQKATGSAPAYVEGGIYYDTTLHKLRIGGAAGWETVTSV